MHDERGIGGRVLYMRASVWAGVFVYVMYAVCLYLWIVFKKQDLVKNQ